MIALLVAVFRSALAPVIAVLPAVVVVLVAERLTAEAAVHGLGVSQIASLLLIVLVLGAGTDYALFLMFRVREEMRAGLPCHEAIVLSVARVGETITFSAGVLIAALLSLATATFSLYSGLAAPLAIAIGLMLIAGLTLLPALLAICGPVAFWPSSVKPGARRHGWWGSTCSRIVRRPLATLVIGLVVFCALAVASAGYLAAGFGGAVTGPAGSDSAVGDTLLARHFPQTAANPTLIVLRLRQPAWAVADSVAAAGRQLTADPVFTSVSGPLNANGTMLTAAQYAALYAAYGPARALGTSAAQVPRTKLAAYQSYRASGSYVSADGYTISFAASLAAGSPTTTAAAEAVPAVRAAAARAARAAGASASGVTGQAAFTYDVAQLSDSDLRTVIPIAIAVIAVLLALVMRSLIAPLYLILSVVLSYFSALGLTVLVFIQGRRAARADVHPAVPAVHVPAGARRGLQHPGHDADQGRGPAPAAARGRGPGAGRHRDDGELGRAGAGRDVRGAGDRGLGQRGRAERQDDRQRRRRPRARRAHGYLPGQDAAGALGGGADRAVELVAVRAVPGAAGRPPGRRPVRRPGCLLYNV